MRMTNKIMQNNSLYNINNNKVLQDKLSTMMATQKKITRPSDDPVIAIRALRLRTSVSELTQYYEKNAPDAESWLDVTTKALENTVTDVLTDMNKISNKAANKEYGSEDLAVFVEQLKSLRDEFYSTGNLDYAGRYVFTGYRTDTPLTFMKDVEENMPSYQITEQTTIEAFDTINYTYTAGLDGLNKNNYANYPEIKDTQVTNGDIHRLRLSYDDLAGGISSLDYVSAKAGQTTDLSTDKTLQNGTKVALTDPVTVSLTADESPTGQAETVTLPAGTEARLKVDAAGNVTGVTIAAGAKVTLADGTEKTLGTDIDRNIGTGAGDLQITNAKILTEPLVSNISTVSLSANPSPYDTVAAANAANPQTSAVVFIPETGELLFSDAAYKDITAKVNTQSEIQVTYGKDKWKNGDLRPEHYFACTKTSKNEDGSTKTVNYNPEYLTNGNTNKQVIEYDVGYNQKIQVNTTADKVFIHALDRDIDDLERALNELVEIDATKTDLDLVLKGMERDSDPVAYDKVKNQYDAAVKAYDHIRENIHTMFEGSITKTQNYLDKTNLAITDNGTRSQRLELIGNRLMDQRTNFKTLQSENEDIDIAEVIIQLTSTELTYNSALMATGKIMQTSLMNYI